MFSVPDKTGRSRLPSEQEAKKWFISLVDVTGRTGKNEIVAPVVSRFPLSWCYVVQCDQRGLDLPFAIRAHRPMTLEQPLAGSDICVA